MSRIPGLAELCAAKQVLLDALDQGIAEADILPAMQELEAFRNSLWQADHLLIRAIERSELTTRHCVSSVEKLVAQTLRISYGDARRRVRAVAAVGPRTTMLGEPLAPVRPELAAAQRTGAVSPVVVDLIECTLARVEILAPDQVSATETLLVGHGKTFEPVELGKICDRVLDHVDPDGTRPRDLIQKDRRALSFTRCRDGMIKVDGRLTPAAGARVKAALDPLAAPRPTTEPGPNGGEKAVPDPRSSVQRMHDALEEGCARLLRAGDVPASGGTPATVILTITEEQLRHATRQARRVRPEPRNVSRAIRRPGDPVDDPVAGTLNGTVETSTGEVLSLAEALRLAAEADVVSLVTTGTGRPLQLGRTRRCASTSQTYALIARDVGCSFPGCTVPPEWCERHHLTAWAAGGLTDVDNLTLLCGYHHAHYAQAGWTCHLDADGLPGWQPPRWQRRDREPLVNARIRRRHRSATPEPDRERNADREPPETVDPDRLQEQDRRHEREPVLV